MLFRSQTHQEVWQDRWCHTCFQPDEAQRRIQGKDTVCPIWERAIRTGRKPPEWDRTRNTDMEKSIKCNSYQSRPASRPTTLQAKEFEDVPMFDVEPTDKEYVPVEGWPNQPNSKGVDHA